MLPWGTPWAKMGTASHLIRGELIMRRKYSKEFKLRVVQEAIEAEDITAVARRYEIDRSILSRWKSSYLKDGEAVLSSKRGRSKAGKQSLQVNREMEKENDRLKKLLGEKDLEIAILKDLVKKGTHL